MGALTNIPWADATWNPWYGCAQVSPACDHCYAKVEMKRYGINPDLVQRSKTTFNAPLKWSRRKDKPCAVLNTPTPRTNARIFTCSWSDFFLDAADTWRPEAWDIIRATPEYTYLILTKRPERIYRCLPKDWGSGWKNVAIGITAEDQHLLDRRMYYLSTVHVPIRFVSLEPLLQAVTLEIWKDKLDWVIAGGENGHHARPVHQDWIRSLARECQEFKIPFFFKGWGRWLPTDQYLPTDEKAWLNRPVMRVGLAGSRIPPYSGRWYCADKESGCLLDGKTYQEMPKFKEDTCHSS